MNLAALGSIAGGINQGLDLSQRDQELKDQKKFREQDRAFQAEQRQFQKDQQTRLAQEQVRQDQLLTDLSAVTRAGDYVYKPSNAGPDRAMQSASGQAREEAAALQKAGDAKAARELFRWADEADAKAASQRYLSTVQGIKPDASPHDFAKALAPVVDGDSSPVGIRNVVPNEDGSVTVEAYNKLTGYSMPQTFRDTKSMQEALMAHYSPDTYNKILESRLKAQEKLNENPYTSVPPGATVIDRRTNKVVYTNPNDRYPIGEDADGNPIYGKPSLAGAGGAGRTSASSRGGKATDPLQAYYDAFETPATKGENKLTEDSYFRAQSFLPALAEQGVAPAVAARIARDAAVDPTKTRLEIDHSTGRIDRIYTNPDVNGGRPVRVAASAGTVADLEKQSGGKKDVVAQDVRSMLGKMISAAPEENRESVANSYIALASDPAKRNAFLKAQIDAGKSPEAVQNLGRQLELIGTYIKPQAAPATNPFAPAGVPAVGGIKPRATDPNSPAGRFQARQQATRDAQAAREAERSKAAQELSAQFDRDKASMDPLEFARKYDSVRFRLPTAQAAELRRIEQGL